MFLNTAQAGCNIGVPLAGSGPSGGRSQSSDAAAAAVIEKSLQGESSEFIDWEMNTFPEGAELTEFRGSGTKHPPNHPTLTKPDDNLFTMKGTRVYRFALASVKKTLNKLLSRNNLVPDDINWMIPHQASGHSVEAATLFGFKKEKVANIVNLYGNCISASIPMTLALYHKEGKIKRGDLCLIGGTGAGLSVAFALIRF